MSLINCEVNLIWTWSANCVIIYTDVENLVPTFTITETNLYVAVVILSTQDNAKLLTQLKSGFKKTIIRAQNSNLNHLVEPIFQEVNRLFVSEFKNNTQRTSNKKRQYPKCGNKRL